MGKPEPTNWDQTWDHELARSIIARLVHIHAGWFAAFREISADDLKSELLIYCHSKWPTYDSARSRPSTFITRIAWCRMWWLHRTRRREGERETKSVLMNRAETGPTRRVTSEPPPVKPMNDAALTDWIGEMYRDVCIQMRSNRIPMRIYRFGRPYLANPAQAMVMALLQARTGFGCKAMKKLMCREPGIVGAIGLPRTPSHMLIYRNRKRVTYLSRIFRRRSAPVPA